MSCPSGSVFIRHVHPKLLVCQLLMVFTGSPDMSDEGTYCLLSPSCLHPRYSGRCTISVYKHRGCELWLPGRELPGESTAFSVGFSCLHRRTVETQGAPLAQTDSFTWACPWWSSHHCPVFLCLCATLEVKEKKAPCLPLLMPGIDKDGGAVTTIQLCELRIQMSL